MKYFPTPWLSFWLTLIVMVAHQRPAMAQGDPYYSSGSSWKQSMEDPITVPVTFYSTFSAWGGFQATLAGAISHASNDFVETCNEEGMEEYWLMDSPGARAQVAVNKIYALTLSGSHVYSAAAQVDPPSLTDLATPGQEAQQFVRYNIYILNGANGRWEKFCSNNSPTWNAENCSDNTNCMSSVCVPMAKTWYIQVRKDIGAKPTRGPGQEGIDPEAQGDGWVRGDEAVDARMAPGDQDVLQMQSGKSDLPAGTAYNWSVFLGRLWNGSSAGRISLSGTQITSDTFSPAAVSFLPMTTDLNETVVVPLPSDTNQTRQILTPQCLADIVTTSTNSFDIRFYLPSVITNQDSDGIYLLSSNATAFVTWHIDSASGTTNNLRISELRPAYTNSSQLSWASSSNTWTLQRGIGNDAFFEHRIVSIAASGGVTNRTENYIMRNGAGVICSRATEVYQRFPWGYSLTSATNDPGGSNLVTSFTYESDPLNDHQYGQILSIVYPDGYWERRIYSDLDWDTLRPYGSLIRIVHPWKDSSILDADNDSLVEEHAYPDGFAGPSYVIQKWHDAASVMESTDTIIESRYRSAVYAEQMFLDTSPCEDSGTIVEWRQLGNIQHYGESFYTKVFDQTAGELAGQVYSKESNSGGFDGYDYNWGAWDPTNKVFVPGAGNNLQQAIYHGTINGVDDSSVVIPYSETGHPFDVIIGLYPLYLTPFQSVKNELVMVNGNLAARSDYLFVGPDITNSVKLGTVIYQRDSLGHATNVYRIDGATAQARTLYTADWTGGAAFPGDLKLSESDESGVVTTYTYDTLKRVRTKTKLGGTLAGYPTQTAITNMLDFDAAANVLTNRTVGSGLSLTNSFSYDLAGRTVSSTSVEGLVTSSVYQNGGRSTITTYSSGTTRSNIAYLDRQPKSITGTGVTNQFFDHYRTDDDNPAMLSAKNVTKTVIGATNSPRWAAAYTDQRYADAGSSRPAFHSTNDLVSYYSFAGTVLPELRVDTWFEDSSGSPGPVRYTKYSWDEFGHKRMEARPGQGNVDYAGWDASDIASTVRIQSEDYLYKTNTAGHWFKVTQRCNFPYDNSSTNVLLDSVWERANGFGAGQVSERYQYDGNTNKTAISVVVDYSNKKVTTTATIAQSSLSSVRVDFNGLLQTETTTSIAAARWHYYDGLGREIAVKDPLGFVAGSAYDSATGQLVARTNQFGYVTTFQYYPAGGTNAGLLKSQITATGTKVYYNYNGAGQQTHVWGDTSYPEQRTYDMFGDLTTLTTYRGGSGWQSSAWPTGTTGTGDTTTWYYDGPTGLLTNKVDAAGKAVAQDYYNNWFPKSRKWARGASSTNYYNDAGDLVQVDYSDASGAGLSSSLILTNYNRYGLPAKVSDASGDHLMVYDTVSRLVSDSCTNGFLKGIVVSNRFNPVLGKDRVIAKLAANSPTNDYAYDTYGRLAGVTNGTYSLSYSYLTGSDLVDTTSSKTGGTVLLTSKRNWEGGSRLASIQNTISASTVSGHTYAYDSLDRRARAWQSDGTFWNYEYNDRDELVAGVHRLANSVPLAGQQFGYTFDNLGNRLSATEGGDPVGGALRLENYTNNSLNQITSKGNASQNDIMGLAYAGATVTVNGAATTRQGEYYDLSLAGGSNSVAAWQAVTNIAVQAGNYVTNTGNLLLPPLSQTFQYDVDGNLTNDMVWSYVWNGENRLVQMTSLLGSGAPNSARKQLQFLYDRGGRRVGKIVSTWNGSGYGSPTTNRFVYDGWMLLAELDGGSTTLRTYAWGKDMEGGLEKAAGVGGLALLQEFSPSASVHFPCYDGNGNVTALLKTDGSVSARYEYGPFGELLRCTGTDAKVNPFRYSTKYMDDETDLLYYGFRYYSASRGRWISRDPLEEMDCVNLYQALRNSPLNCYDADGRFVFVDMLLAMAEDEGVDAARAKQQIGLISRVRDMAKQLQFIQSFQEGYQEAVDLSNGGGLSEMIENMNKVREEFAKGGPLGRNHRHHLISQAFIKQLKNIKNMDVHKLTAFINEAMHLKGLHGGGNIYNEIVGDFINKNLKKIRSNPMFLIGFVTGIMNESGLGDAFLNNLSYL
ncbi:MAG TPA: RHS repeat-associated core domain-containing protein [Candidatus Limnocylindria bacterium]|nr:RHS repeat-associated core domain-containing protein [Candidatus Limnocylindria bacterium]